MTAGTLAVQAMAAHETAAAAEPLAAWATAPDAAAETIFVAQAKGLAMVDVPAWAMGPAPAQALTLTVDMVGMAGTDTRRTGTDKDDVDTFDYWGTF